MTPRGPTCLGAGKTTSTLLDELFSEPQAVKESSVYHTSPGRSPVPELHAEAWPGATESLDFVQLLPAWDGDWGLQYTNSNAGGSSQVASLQPAAPSCPPLHPGVAQASTHALGAAGATTDNHSGTVRHGSTSGQNAQAPPQPPAAQESATVPAAPQPLWAPGPSHVAGGTDAADLCTAAGTAASAAAAAAAATTTTTTTAAAAAAAAAVPCFDRFSAHSAPHAIPAGVSPQPQLHQPLPYNDVPVTAYGGGIERSAAMQGAALHGLAASSLGMGGEPLGRCIGSSDGSNTHNTYPWGQQQGHDTPHVPFAQGLVQPLGRLQGQQAWMQAQLQQQWQQLPPLPPPQQPPPPQLHQQLSGGPLAGCLVAQRHAQGLTHMHTGGGAAAAVAGSAGGVGQFPRHLLPQIPSRLCVPPMVPPPMCTEPAPTAPRWSQASSMGIQDRRSCSSYPSFNSNSSELMRSSHGSFPLSGSGRSSSSSSSVVLTMAPHAPPGVSGWAAGTAVAHQGPPVQALPLLQQQQQQTWRHTWQQQQQQEQQLGQLKRSWSDAAEALGPCAHVPLQARPRRPPGHSVCGAFPSLELSRTASLPIGVSGCLFPGTVPRVSVPQDHPCAPPVGWAATTHGSPVGPGHPSARNTVAPTAATATGAPCAPALAASKAAPTTHGSLIVPAAVNCARVPCAPASAAPGVSQLLALSSGPQFGPAAGSLAPLLPGWLWHNGPETVLDAPVPSHVGGTAWDFSASATEALVSPFDQLPGSQPRGSATMTSSLAAAAAPAQDPEAPPSPPEAPPPGALPMVTQPPAAVSAPGMQPVLHPLPPIPTTHPALRRTSVAPTRAPTHAAATAAATAAAAAGEVTAGSPPASAAFKRFQLLFDAPAREAAHSLGICASEFKKRCRRAGIIRWPQRRLLSLVRMAKRVQADKRMGRDDKKEVLALIAANLAEIRADPSAPYNPLLDSLRKSQYKRRSVARRSSRGATAGSAARGGRGEHDSSSDSDESGKCDESDEGAEEQEGAVC